MATITDYLHGVDVSEYQPNWTPDPADSFYILKGSGGHAVNGSEQKHYRVDPSLGTKRALTRATGRPLGYYHFLVPSQYSVSPEDQARFFVANMNPLPGEFLVCDWEKVRVYSDPVDANKNIWLLPPEEEKDRFIAECKRLAPDNKVGMYCNGSQWSDSNKNCGDFLWVAVWRTDPGTTDWTFWQYTNIPIDQNVANFKDPIELKEFFAAPEKRLYELALANNDLLVRIAKKLNA